MTGKRKYNTDQSAKSIELPNMSHREEKEQAHTVTVKNTSPQIVPEAQGAAKRVKDNPQLERYMTGAAIQNGTETVEGHKKQFGISSLYAMGEIPISSSCVVSTETEKRATCTAENRTCLGTPYDVSRKCDVPPTKGMSDPSVQTPLVDKDVELATMCRITKGKDDNKGEKTQEDYTGKGRSAHMDFHKTQKQNDVLANLYVDKHADGSQLESGNERDMDWRGDAYALESLPEQKKGTSMRENSRSDREMIPRDDSHKFDSRSGEMALDNVDHSAVKQVHAANVDREATIGRIGTNRKSRPDEQKKDESCSSQDEPNCSKCGDCSQAIETHTSDVNLRKRREPIGKETDNKVDFDKKNKHNLIENGRDAHYDDGRTYRNTAAAGTSKYKHRGRTQLDRGEEHGGRNDRTRLRSHSLERQRADYRDSHPGTNNRHRYYHDDRRKPYEDKRGDRDREQDTSKHKSRERTGSNIRVEPVESNSHRNSRKHSLERQRMDYRGSYSGTNNGHRYEPPSHVKSSMNDHDAWRQQGWRSSFPQAEFGGNRRHAPSPNHEDGEYKTNQKCISSSYTRRHTQVTSRRLRTPPYPRRSEDVGQSTSRDLWYDKYNNFKYGGYHTADIDPVSRYSAQYRKDGTHRSRRVQAAVPVYQRSAGGYGERSGHRHRNVPAGDLRLHGRVCSTPLTTDC